MPSVMRSAVSASMRRGLTTYLLILLPLAGALTTPVVATPIALAASQPEPFAHHHPTSTPPPPTTTTPTSSPTTTSTPTATTTNTSSPTATGTPSATATPTATGTPSTTGTPTATSTPTSTGTQTATGTPTPTGTPSGTVTPTPPGNIAAFLAGQKVVNYYPAANSWANMWSNWVPTTIDADFGRIAALHATTVRIIIQASTFGYPTPQPTMLSHLADILTMAHNHGLQVQLTLFDWWNGYTDLSGSQAWANAVVGPYKGDPRIAFIEVQNEIDTTNTQAVAWARQMVPYIRSIDGGIPVTISVYTLSGLSTLVSALQAAPPDFYDFHYYGAQDLAYTDLAQAKAIVAPAPLFIGETGFSSALSNTNVGGLPDNTPALEAYQDYFLRAVADAAQTLGLPSVAPWVLSDFMPGALTWLPANSPEYSFGLYHTDGSAKPAAAAIANYFTGAGVDTSFNNGFENCAGGTPADWLLYHTSEATFACDSSVAHSGGASARISASSGDSGGLPAFFLTPTNTQVVPGQVYTASVWARGQNAIGTTQIAIAWFDANGNYLGTLGSALLPAGATNWTQLTVSQAAPPGAAFVQIHCKSGYNSGTVWFDDVTFQ